MSPRIGLVQIVVFLFLSIAGRAAGEPAPELMIEGPPQLAAVAEQIRELQRGDFSNILVLTGRMGFTEPIRVVLMPDGSPAEQAAPGWVSGFARGGDGVVVLFPSRVRSYPDRNLRMLLHHEVAHVILARAARHRSVPRWFNEGVATVAAREWGLEDRARYAFAVIGTRPRSVRELDAGFNGDSREVRRAYALSAAFVRFIQRRYGVFAPAQVLDGVAEGRSFEEAFLRATGVTLRRAEWRFFEREAFWNTWLPFLTSSGALWMAITALALVAVVRRRRRSAAMREVWEVEEALEEQERETVN